MAITTPIIPPPRAPRWPARVLSVALHVSAVLLLLSVWVFWLSGWVLLTFGFILVVPVALGFAVRRGLRAAPRVRRASPLVALAAALVLPVLAAVLPPAAQEARLRHRFARDVPMVAGARFLAHERQLGGDANSGPWIAATYESDATPDSVAAAYGRGAESLGWRPHRFEDRDGAPQWWERGRSELRLHFAEPDGPTTWTIRLTP